MVSLLRKKITPAISFFFLLCAFGLTACAAIPKERAFSDFIIVKTDRNDSLISLATKYLNDPKKDWLIAEFNNVEILNPGQELIIPLSPFAWGGLRADGFRTVPVLVYHGFSQDKNKISKSIVAEQAFKEQMKFLKDNGYRVITLDNLLDFIDFKIQIPEKSVAITFDNGLSSIYEIAFPILKSYGFPSTLFICTDFVGGEDTLSWDQLLFLSENGLDIQSKTRTNRKLAKPKKRETLKDYVKALEVEISHSKKTIEKKLNRQCKYLAYPYGETNDLVIALLKRHGYSGAFTMERGSNPFFVNNFRINRSVVTGEFSIKQFKENLSVFTKSQLN